MRFSLIPREMKFFDMFNEAVAILSRSANKLLELVSQFDRLVERSDDLKQEERACDEVVRRIFTSLDLTFITPIDREDIHALANSLDDIMDNVEETAYRFVEFRIEKPPSQTIIMARIVRDCCDHMEQAVRLCRDMGNAPQIQQHLEEITRLENEADIIYRSCDSALFASPPDVLQLIKVRELYAWLEETVDACKDASQVIAGIIVKGA
jgi:predicted phosphate transport protein (TIGR00153 family)